MIGKWYASGLMMINTMNIHQSQIARSMERLSTGQRINRAADDPAGLAISEKMRAQIRGLQVAERNIQDSISLFQTAEGALNEHHAMLLRLKELAVQASNASLTDHDRELLDIEFQELKKEIERTSKETQFNTRPLLDGSFKSFKVQAGANAGQTIDFKIEDMGINSLKLEDASIATIEEAEAANSLIDQASKIVSRQRAQIGASMNRLEHAYNNASNMKENLIAAESRIRDTDIAKEMMALTKANILLQASQSILSLHMQQANSVLTLLRQNLE